MLKQADRLFGRHNGERNARVGSGMKVRLRSQFRRRLVNP
jgi:hypothetical protein